MKVFTFSSQKTWWTRWQTQDMPPLLSLFLVNSAAVISLAATGKNRARPFRTELLIQLPVVTCGNLNLTWSLNNPENSDFLFAIDIFKIGSNHQHAAMQLPS